MAEAPAAARPKPHLVRFLEAVAAIMELHEGQQRLELTFRDGRLIRWWSHDESNEPAELERFDREAAWLIERTALGTAGFGDSS